MFDLVGCSFAEVVLAKRKIASKLVAEILCSTPLLAAITSIDLPPVVQLPVPLPFVS